jgi:hypothetical protein
MSFLPVLYSGDASTLVAIETSISLYCYSIEIGAFVVILNILYATAISHAVKDFELKRYNLMLEQAVTFTDE